MEDDLKIERKTNCHEVVMSNAQICVQASMVMLEILNEPITNSSVAITMASNVHTTTVIIMLIPYDPPCMTV